MAGRGNLAARLVADLAGLGVACVPRVLMP